MTRVNVLTTIGEARINAKIAGRNDAHLMALSLLRDAVCELVAADREYNAATVEWDFARFEAVGSAAITAAHHKLVVARLRRRVALQNFGDLP